MLAFEPTQQERDECEILLASGWPQSDIARYLGIDEKTLRKAFREELDDGYLKRRAQVTIHLFRCAIGGTGVAARHWLALQGNRSGAKAE
jgi:hypothetical protein